MIFDHLPETSKVWIYASQQPLNELATPIKRDLNEFIQSWAAHGDELYGAAGVLKNRFIVLCVDESKVAASGCSIDSSTRFIKSLESKYGLNLFDRLHLIIEKEDEQKNVHITEVSAYHGWNVYNPMITTLGELQNNWRIPVEVSPFV